MAKSIDQRVKHLEKVVRILAERGPGPDVAKMMGAKLPDEPEADDPPAGEEPAGSAE